jgi:zinc-ribbon domain
MFCIYCGASNPDNAAFCSVCGEPTTVPSTQPAVAVPEQKQAPELEKAPESAQFVSVSSAPIPALPNPPKPRSHALRNITWIAVAIAAAIIAADLLSGPSPKDSLEKAGAAFAHQDAQAFDNYVDVQSVLGDWTDQAARSWLAHNNSNAGDTLIANGLVLGFKSLIVPKLASSVEQEILSNRTSDQPQSNDSDNATDYMTSFLSSGIHSSITSQLSYQGIASQTQSGSDAVLDVRVGSPLSNTPLIVKVEMQRVRDHWRIVAIPDVAGLLAQLHQAH